MKNNKIELNIGDIVVNNSGHSAKILDKFIKKRNNSTKTDKMVILEFIESGYRDAYCASNVKKHKFKDYGSPSVYGVGHTYKEARGKFKYINKTWTAMIRRCYDKNWKFYKDYGGRGVRVSKQWLHLKNFIEDIKDLKNYDKYIKEPHKYSLDKDILGDGTLYSKDTCMFATVKEQNNATRRGKPIKSTSPDGVMAIHDSIKLASEETGVYTSCIHKVLNGEYTHTNGYKFERL